MTYGPLIRIGLRYLAGILIARGALDPDLAQMLATDPDVIDLIGGILTEVPLVVGALIGGLSELWYAAARRRGGAT